MGIKISELIDKLTEFKNNIGDVSIGIDNGYGISWLEDIRENTAYEILSDNEDAIKFIELKFYTIF